jgi:hypothetical protein
MPTSLDASRLAARVSDQARRAAKLAFNEARAVLGSDGTTFMSVEAQEAKCRRIREVRCVNNVKLLDMTIINNPAGVGVVISKLGCGTASAAGMLVGDVIECTFVPIEVVPPPNFPQTAPTTSTCLPPAELLLLRSSTRLFSVILMPADINGVKVTSHEQAFATMHACTCRDLAFSLDGSPRKVCIDKAQPGKVQITLTNRKGKGAGVEVEAVGLMGLAANAGLTVGDVILSINGILLDDHETAVAMLDSSERFVDFVVAERVEAPPEHGAVGSDMYRAWDDSSVVLTGI